MTDYLTTTYVNDLLAAKTPDGLTFATVRALEVAGHNTDLVPDLPFTIWALAGAAKARRQEFADLYPKTGLHHTMVAMGAYSPMLPSFQIAGALA